MTPFSSPARLFLLGVVSCCLARAASDPRTIVCTRPCSLSLKAANGSIDIKVPLASGTLKTLYQPGDQYSLEGGKSYVLFFNESKDGFFSFDLQFAPSGPGAAWSCRVRTVPEAPFIRVDHQAWSSPDGAGKVTINTEKGKPFISIQG